MPQQSEILFPTYSGRIVNLLNPSADSICLEDIARHLSGQVRYFGASRRPYHTAEHCIRLAIVAPDMLPPLWGDDSKIVWAREALLHDAHEAYCGEIPRMIKHSDMMADYRHVEFVVDQCVRYKFGMLVGIPPELKSLDNSICRLEMQSGLFEDDYYPLKHGFQDFNGTQGEADRMKVAMDKYAGMGYYGWGWRACFELFLKKAAECGLE